MTFYKVLIICLYQIIISQSLIPGLRVRKLDQQIIQRKRQDTLDMCRIFNSENEKLKKNSTIQSMGQIRNNNHIRRKRNTDTLKLGNPSLNADDIKRVETIVDKLYDDLQEQGQKVTYRQKDLSGLTTAKPETSKNKTLQSRRFNFRPAALEYSEHKESKTKDSIVEPPETVEVSWPKKWKHGIIPYFIDSKTYDAQLSEEIVKAFDYLEKATCIRLQRLRERPTDKDSLQSVEWLYITNPAGIKQCVHSNERKRNKGVQMVVFGYDCLSLGEIVHEIMHVLGFAHEHTRPDRDQYITILWDNIKPGYKKYFEIHNENTVLNLPYDYSSVMHYPSRAFSRNGQVTILAEGGVKLGQREGLSEYDVEKISMIFGNECVERNKQYLLTTCPRAVKTDPIIENVTQDDIQNYFKNRLWPFGIINYKLRDMKEFSIEEIENINAVIRHIEKETCIEFREISAEKKDTGDNEDEARGKINTENNMELNHTNNGIKNNIASYEVNNAISDGGENIVSKENTQSVNKSIISTNQKGQPENEANTNPQAPIVRFGLVKENQFKKPSISKTDGNNKTMKLHKNSNSKTLAANVKMRVRRSLQFSKLMPSSRRHAENIITLVRSPEPGCRCPAPGRPTGNSVIEINADCFNSVNDLLHFFVHILGLDHQHNMYDRDSYLHILWDKLSPEIRTEMEENLPPAASVGFSYDYQSVMHYPWLQIKNGVTNIMYPIWNDGWAMGHWQGLSSTDVQKLNLLYFEQCQERKKQVAETLNNRRYNNK